LLVDTVSTAILFEADASGVFGTTPLDFAGMLAPGSYRVIAEASFAGGGIGDSAGWDFALRQVPEPSTGLLVVVGLFGFAGWRRD
jgi:hypothetical protein